MRNKPLLPTPTNHALATGMIHPELLRDQGILIVTPEGPLQQADFEALAQLVYPFIESQGELYGLLIHTESFPGWSDFAALLSHLKFVKTTTGTLPKLPP